MITKNVLRSYVVALSLIILLLTIAQVLVQYFLAKQKDDATIVNIAGRQRMLSQKLTKQLIYLNYNKVNSNFINEFNSDLKQFAISYLFVEGKTTINLINNTNTKNQEQLIKDLNLSYKPFIKAIKNYFILSQKKDSVLIEVLKQEKEFLPKMNALVNEYEKENTDKINELKRVEIILFLFTFFALLFEIIIIFNPLFRSLYFNNKLLEQTSEITNTGGWEYSEKTDQFTLSKQSARIFGLQKKIISKHEFCELIHQQEFKNHFESINDADVTLTITVDKNTRWILFTKKKNEKLNKVYGIIKDITAEKESDIYKQKLEEKNDSLLKLNYGLTHDIKNHTSNVIGLIGILKKHEQKKNYDKLEEIIERTEFSAQQLNNILSDFLYLSRSKDDLEKSFKQLNEEKIKEALEEEIAFIKQEKPVFITYKFNVEDVIYSNHIVKIILINLVSNSIKYSKPNQNAHVDVLVTKSEKNLLIEVKDNGIGMDLKSPQNKLFTLFEQLDSRTEGFGIGLAILKKIVDQQSGKIKVESEIGIGTTFKVFIPLQQ